MENLDLYFVIKLLFCYPLFNAIFSGYKGGSTLILFRVSIISSIFPIDLERKVTCHNLSYVHIVWGYLETYGSTLKTTLFH